MSTFLPFVFIGIVSGSIYGLMGTGIVLTYRTSGIVNLGYAAPATLSAYAFYFLHYGSPRLSWPVAMVTSVAVLGPLAGLAMSYVSRLIAPLSTAWQVVSTVGIALSVESAARLWYPESDGSRRYLPYLPVGRALRVAGVNVSWQQVIVVVVALIAAGGLQLVVRATRIGLAMRALVDSPSLLALTGSNPGVARKAAWVIAATLSSLAGVLIAPSLSVLDAAVLTSLVLQAFGAAAIGAFTNMPLTYAGGIAIGILSALSTKYVGSVSWLVGLPSAMPFLILFVVMIAMPRRRLMHRQSSRLIAAPERWTMPPRIQWIAGVAVLTGLGFVPHVAGFRLPAFTVALCFAMIFMSLGLLVRVSGQVSLCQLGFAAVGAAVFARASVDWHVPFALALLLGGLAAAPVGAVVALPAIRLSGMFVAIATFGFGVLLEQMVYLTPLMFGTEVTGLPAARPGWGGIGSDRGFYYVVLVCACLTAGALACVNRSRLGRLLRALNESPRALETNGTSVNAVKVLVFSISAFVAGTAGALLASNNRFATGSDFSSMSSLTLLAAVVLVQVGAPWFAVIGAALFVLVPTYIRVANIGDYIALAFGLGAVLNAGMLESGHVSALPAAVRQAIDRLGRRGRNRNDVAANAPLEGVNGRLSVTLPATRKVTVLTDPFRDDGLEVRGLTIVFGGVRAVDSLSLRAPTGRITGLIGPNGAGKTTTFNACTGLLRPGGDPIWFKGRSVSRHSPALRARLGMGRTFQIVELCPSLTVYDNVRLGREASSAGVNPRTQLVATRSELREAQEETERAMRDVGIWDLRERPVRQLAAGQKRLVELARALAGGFDLLLLDEPSSGLDQLETRSFGEVLSQAVESRGLGVLLVEHDMALIMSICAYVYVMEFGRLVFDGPPSEVRASSVVAAAYLGS
jgi:ABC-type branched-subunit amino acid transport system ATPase component/branched-subunit amino acid ABC-type transport system permease component